MTRNTYSILFYIKRSKSDLKEMSNIYMRITLNGSRSDISINRKVHFNKWDVKSNKVRGNGKDSMEINSFIDLIRYKINKIHQSLVEDEERISPKRITSIFKGQTINQKMILEEFLKHNNRVKSLIGIDYSKSTSTRYHTAYKHLMQFLNEELKIDDCSFSEISHSFINKYEYFLKTTRGCNHNSTLKYINNFKKIVRIAYANDWISKDPFFNYKAKFEWKEREYLTETEIHTLISKPLHTPRLDLVRDMFVFSCFTGLAYADVKKLSKDDIIIGVDGEQWIKTNRTKNNNTSSIPLLSPALKIINKYKQQQSNENSIIPVLSNQKANAYLKEIADLCNIHKNLTTHLARHTFATTVTLSNGVPIETVSRMLGHKSLRSTQHYAKIIDNKVSDDMKILRQKINY